MCVFLHSVLLYVHCITSPRRAFCKPPSLSISLAYLCLGTVSFRLSHHYLVYGFICAARTETRPRNKTGCGRARTSNSNIPSSLADKRMTSIQRSTRCDTLNNHQHPPRLPITDEDRASVPSTPRAHQTTSLCDLPFISRVQWLKAPWRRVPWA